MIHMARDILGGEITRDNGGRYAGRHRLSDHWCWIYRICVKEHVGFRVNLNGGAFK